MILVQHPTQLSFAPPSTHRRLPSAPLAVVVQATRTPGLLSLSKPSTRPSQPRQQQHQPQQRSARPSPKSKPAAARNRSPQPIQPASDNAPSQESPQNYKEVAEKKQVATPEKSTRGRQQAKLAKDKASRRSASQSSVTAQPRRSGHIHRQPSPPVHTPISSSQAEVPRPYTLPRIASSTTRNIQPFAKRGSEVITSDNLFDPFIVNASDSDSSTPDMSTPTHVRTRPAIISQFSGKLARRRQPTAVPSTPTPASSKTVSIPRPKLKVSRPSTVNISRSEPVTSSMRPPPKRLSAPGPIQWDAFPVCDDTGDDASPPVTPTRRRVDTSWHSVATLSGGPRTAPLSSASSFPFGRFSMATSTPTRRRTHNRAPSEGDIFPMSMDEDSSSSDASEDLRALMGLPMKRMGRSGSPGDMQDKAGYFASSMFQNSPSPEDLPPPPF